jgi:hypothetical protein
MLAIPNPSDDRARTPMTEPEPPYHLVLDPEELPVTASALRLLISGEAHQQQIRMLAREVLAELEEEPDERGRLTVTLAPRQMKIVHSAAHLLLDDLGREQADERAILRRILEKLPDEHTMRAIALD